MKTGCRAILNSVKAAGTTVQDVDFLAAKRTPRWHSAWDGFDWNWEAADKEFRRAIELNPGYATAHHWYSLHLSLFRAEQRGHRRNAKGAENLDPLSLIINTDLGELLVIAHFLDESMQQSRMKSDLTQASSCDPVLIRYVPTRASRTLGVALGFLCSSGAHNPSLRENTFQPLKFMGAIIWSLPVKSLAP